MAKSKQKTKVIFRKFVDNDEVIAFFPELPGSYDPRTCLTYLRVGQHGSGIADVSGTLKASEKEYSSLLKELTKIGYDLEIVHKFTQAHFNARRRVI